MTMNLVKWTRISMQRHNPTAKQIICEKALTLESKLASVLLEGSIWLMRVAQNQRTVIPVMIVARFKILNQMEVV